MFYSFACSFYTVIWNDTAVQKSFQYNNAEVYSFCMSTNERSAMVNTTQTIVFYSFTLASCAVMYIGTRMPKSSIQRPVDTHPSRQSAGYTHKSCPLLTVGKVLGRVHRRLPLSYEANIKEKKHAFKAPQLTLTTRYTPVSSTH